MHQLSIVVGSRNRVKGVIIKKKETETTALIIRQEITGHMILLSIEGKL